MTKKEIIELYLADLNNLVPDSDAKRSRIIDLEDEFEALSQTDVSGSGWEQKLIGKNIHSVFTWCKDCHNEGINIPFNDECGNCGSKNTVRYYDKETIDLLF
jgi:hypothetical protein